MTFSCFIIGEGPLAHICAKLLLERGHKLQGVASQGQDLCDLAQHNGIPFYSSTPDLEPILAAHSFDYLFSIVWRHILPSSILSMPYRFAINFHDGPLPRYAGTHATPWALINMESRHGITWHIMTKRVDSGDILHQKIIDIDSLETTRSLDLKCLEAGSQTFEALITELASGTEIHRPQNLEHRLFYPSNQRPENGAVLAWRKTAGELDALCRALDYGSRRENDFALPKIVVGEEFLIVKSNSLQQANEALPGTILSMNSRNMTVAAGEGALNIEVLSTIDGHPVQLSNAISQYGLKVGSLLSDVVCEFGNRINEVQDHLVKGEKFWCERFSRLEPLELPYPVTRASSTGPRHWECIKFEKSTLVQNVTGSYGIDRDGSNVLAATFVAFLARLSSRNRFHVWFSHERLVQALEGLTGLYAPYVPLEIDITADAGCCDLIGAILAEIEQTARYGIYHRDIFARHPEYHWMTQSMGIEISTVEESNLLEAPLSVFLRFVTSRDGTGFSLIYDPAVLEQSTAREIGPRFLTFLSGMTAAPENPVRVIPLLTQEERCRIICEWNATEDTSVSDACVHQLIEEQARKGPDRIAAVCNLQKLTYRELNQKANTLAEKLLENGVLRGCFVPVAMHSGFNLIISYLAIMKVGAVFVPLDPLWPMKRIERILDNLRLRVIFLEAGDLDTDELRTYGEASSIIKVDHHSLVGQADNLNRISSHDDPIYMVFTSGSTGIPKGVINSHRGVIHRFFGSNQDYRQLGLELKEMTVLNTSSPVFDPSIRQLLWPLTVGGRTVIPSYESRSDLDYILEHVEREKVTTTSLVSPLFNVLTEQLATSIDSRKKLHTLKHLLIGGEQVDAKTVYRFIEFCPHVAIRNIYGPSEAAMGVISYTVDSVTHSTLPIGKPLPNVTAFILNDDLEPMPVGAIGELYIGGPQVGLGYLNDPKSTSAAFIRNPFVTVDSEKLYRTGDFARFLPDGNIVFIGRKDDQVKIRGIRVELDEIRDTLDTHPGVKESVVITVDDRSSDRTLVAYIVPIHESESLEPELTDYLGRLLPAAYIPAIFVILERLPRLSSGKIDRHRLPVPNRSKGLESGPETLPKTPLEAAITSILNEVLGLELFNQDMDIFDLGADSISLMRIINRIRQHFGVEFSMRDIFMASTARAIALRIEELKRQEEASD